VRVAFDEQIFVTQRFGGISRLFAELSRQYTQDPSFGVELQPLASPVVNRYLLDDPHLNRALAVWQAGSPLSALGRYFTHVRPRVAIDVVHNTFYLPHGLAGYPGAKRVVTVHDMIPEMLPSTRRRLDLITLKRRYVRQADHIICVSHATKADLLATYSGITAPVSVVHHGVDPRLAPGAPAVPGLPDRYVLLVGHRGQYKDAQVLMEAFATVSDPDLHLVLIGGGPLTSAECRELDRLCIRARTLQVTLPDDRMPAAYGNAVMCVLPSRFEGFGLPALEAMACGTPTILARGSSLPEVGGDAAWYFTPGDARELGERIRELLSDDASRADLATRGIARAAGFTWHATAEATARVYAQTLG